MKAHGHRDDNLDTKHSNLPDSKTSDDLLKLANAYSKGEGTEQDLGKAAYYFRMANGKETTPQLSKLLNKLESEKSLDLVAHYHVGIYLQGQEGLALLEKILNKNPNLFFELWLKDVEPDSPDYIKERALMGMLRLLQAKFINKKQFSSYNILQTIEKQIGNSSKYKYVQNTLGNIYSQGIHKMISADPVKAVQWWQKGAEKYNKNSMSNLASAYFTGKGVEQDFGKAAYYYGLSNSPNLNDIFKKIGTEIKKSGKPDFEVSYHSSMFNQDEKYIAHLFKENPAQFIDLWQRDLNNEMQIKSNRDAFLSPTALIMMSKIIELKLIDSKLIETYHLVETLNKIKKEQISQLKHLDKKYWNHDLLDEIIDYGVTLWNLNEKAHAAEIWKIAAKHQYPLAYSNLGFVYRLGQGKEKNLAKSVYFYRLGNNANMQADLKFIFQEEEKNPQPNLTTRYHLGVAYHIPKSLDYLAEILLLNPKLFFELWEKDVKTDIPTRIREDAMIAMFNLINAGKINNNEIKKYNVLDKLESEREKITARSQRYLGNLFASAIKNLDMKADPKKAVYWWQKAADKGDSKAMHRLGDAYFQGNGVKEKDLGKAAHYYRLANKAIQNDLKILMTDAKKNNIYDFSLGYQNAMQFDEINLLLDLIRNHPDDFFTLLHHDLNSPFEHISSKAETNLKKIIPKLSVIRDAKFLQLLETHQLNKSIQKEIKDEIQKKPKLLDIIKGSQTETEVIAKIKMLLKNKDEKLDINELDISKMNAKAWIILLGYSNVWNTLLELGVVQSDVKTEQKTVASSHEKINKELKKDVETPFDFFKRNLDQLNLDQMDLIFKIIIDENLSNRLKARAISLLIASGFDINRSISVGDTQHSYLSLIILLNKNYVPLLTSLGAERLFFKYHYRLVDEFLEQQSYDVLKAILSSSPFRSLDFTNMNWPDRNISLYIRDWDEQIGLFIHYINNNRQLSEVQKKELSQIIEFGNHFLRNHMKNKVIVDNDLALLHQLVPTLNLKNLQDAVDCIKDKLKSKDATAPKDQKLIDQLYFSLGEIHLRQFNYNKLTHDSSVIPEITHAFGMIKDANHLNANQNYLVGDWLAHQYPPKKANKNEPYSFQDDYSRFKSVWHLVSAWQQENIKGKDKNFEFFGTIENRLSPLLLNPEEKFYPFSQIKPSIERIEAFLIFEPLKKHFYSFNPKVNVSKADSKSLAEISELINTAEEQYKSMNVASVLTALTKLVENAQRTMNERDTNKISAELKNHLVELIKTVKKTEETLATKAVKSVRPPSPPHTARTDVKVPKKD